MKIDKTYFLKIAEDLLTTPSPSGFCHEIMNKIESYAYTLNLPFYRTNKGNGIIEFKGSDSDYCIGLSAHVDTLGLMVRSINGDGTLNVTTIGGNQVHSLIGEYCTVITRSNKKVRGTILSKSYSSHVHEDTNKEKKFEDLMIRLDEVVSSKEDANNLGIDNGDFIAIDSKTEIFDNGFIKSRHIDDKISVAIIFTLFKAWKDAGLMPKHTIKFIVSTYEEVGHGASFIPHGIKELIAVDMGCIGKDLACTEFDVSICAKDSSGPYDYEMTSSLIRLAKEQQLKYAVDIYPYYGSDATAALRGGNDIKAALIGPGVHASHGVERTHYDGCKETISLLSSYLIE